MGVFYVFSFISCNQSKEKNEKSESFAEIIKDSAQRMELLHIADSINLAIGINNFTDSTDSADSVDDNKDTVAENIKYDMRHHLYLTIQENYPPTVRMSMKFMKRLIGNGPIDKGDTLIFYLGAYKHQAQVDRYNDKYGTNYSLAQLKGRPTFLIQKSTTANFLKSPTHVGGRLCPPPPGGCE